MGKDLGGPWTGETKSRRRRPVTEALRVLSINLHRRKLDTGDMLWISLGRDTARAEEGARHSGLPAAVVAADTPEWKKRDTRRCRVIVLELPASSAFVQEVLAAAQDAVRPLPVVILDRQGDLDESL